MVVNQEINWSKSTEKDLHEEHKDPYEKYKDIIKNYTKDEDVPETTEEDEEYENAVKKGYEIYLKKSKGRMKKSKGTMKKSEGRMKKSEGRMIIHPEDKWVMLVKGIREKETRGGKRRKQKGRTKKKSRKAKKKTKRSRK